MGISVTCPACGRESKIKEKYAGRVGGCPFCHAPIKVPGKPIDTSWLQGLEDDPQPAGEDPGQSSVLRSPTAKPGPSSSVSLYRPGGADNAGKPPLAPLDASSSGPRLGKPATPPPAPTGEMTSFHCPRCNRRMKVDSSLIGRSTKCNGCGQQFKIPEPALGRPVDAAWAEALDEELALPVTIEEPGRPLPKLPQPRPYGGNDAIVAEWIRLAGVVGFVAALLAGYLLGGFRGLISGGSIFCWMAVIITMFRNQRILVGVLSLFPCGGPLLAFIVGWMRVNEWNLGLVMIPWTAIMAIGIVTGTAEALQRGSQPHAPLRERLEQHAPFGNDPFLPNRRPEPGEPPGAGVP